jgi:hypothetical protein
MNELCGNVTENKGPLWKTGGKSGNVYENKASYLSKAGMSLKTHGLSSRAAGCFQSPAALSSWLWNGGSVTMPIATLLTKRRTDWAYRLAESPS